MAVVLEQKHLKINEGLAKESNKSAKKFNHKNYLKVENIEAVLINRDISVEKKKQILIKKLHEAIIKAFSIDKKTFNKNAIDALRKKMHIIRRIIIKLRSINYYLETIFLQDLRLSGKIKSRKSKLRQNNPLARDELESLEYSAYRLIGQVVMLDKKLLSGYSQKEKKILKEEKIDIRDLEAILKKESADMIKKIAVKNGMKTMIEDGFEKAAQGITTVAEVLRVIHE